ncbi:expressed unknown protein [Seminavis robusta]|uniref:Uncharacterized protein n=1 Tax=Seminavis robusta TaxID=568900 RepID=A0A9N8DCP6_9STRA|nr:expressed unknown protein [Seminavis robusta]|eukprot:Sro92_g048201.1  (147) ;mRNA; f:92211-92779
MDGDGPTFVSTLTCQSLRRGKANVSCGSGTVGETIMKNLQTRQCQGQAKLEGHSRTIIFSQSQNPLKKRIKADATAATENAATHHHTKHQEAPEEDPSPRHHSPSHAKPRTFHAQGPQTNRVQRHYAPPIELPLAYTQSHAQAHRV